MLEKTINKLNSLESNKIINNLALTINEVISEIIDRTQSGKDSENNFFKPYSKQYATSKYKEFGTKTVNLTRTQKMLNAITFKKTDNGITIYFNSTEQNAKAYYNHVKNDRKFFALTDNEYEIIRNAIKKQITK